MVGLRTRQAWWRWRSLRESWGRKLKDMRCAPKWANETKWKQNTCNMSKWATGWRLSIVKKWFHVAARKHWLWLRTIFLFDAQPLEEFLHPTMNTQPLALGCPCSNFKWFPSFMTVQWPPPTRANVYARIFVGLCRAVATRGQIRWPDAFVWLRSLWLWNWFCVCVIFFLGGLWKVPGCGDIGARAQGGTQQTRYWIWSFEGIGRAHRHRLSG